MTTIFKRDLPAGQSATHAFVIGVGEYPECKEGKGADAGLRAVPDIPSAADSAKLVCDWLIDKQDALGSPLASLEVLIGEPAKREDVKPYDWRHPSPCDPPTLESVKKAGRAWVKRLSAQPGDVALFYACGHGARLASEPVLFLGDLNVDEIEPWGAYLNLGATALAFKQLVPIKSAFFFVDACQEFSVKLELIKTGGGAQIIQAYSALRLAEARDKVTLLCAASDGRLAYEGDWIDDPKVKIGRFTQVLLKALDGAAARPKDNRWTVHHGSLMEDLKLLHRAWRPDWRDKPFEPSQVIGPNEMVPIVWPPNPEVPILIRTDPEQAMNDYDLRIFSERKRVPPCVAAREKRDPTDWLAWVNASRLPLFAVAENSDGVFYEEIFTPQNSIYDQRIRIS